MAEFRQVAKPGDIEEGEMSAFTIEGAKVAIVNVQGHFFAFGDTCTHAHCSLAGASSTTSPSPVPATEASST